MTRALLGRGRIWLTSAVNIRRVIMANELNFQGNGISKELVEYLDNRKKKIVMEMTEKSDGIKIQIFVDDK